jgi:hypothetical protein
LWWQHSREKIAGDKPNETLTPDQVSAQSLKEVFEASFMDAAIEKDGRLIVRDKYQISFTWHEGRERIRVSAHLRARDKADPVAKLRYVNHVNDQLSVVRACVTDEGTFFYDFYIPVAGGITRRAFVMAVRFFVDQVQAAIDLDKENVVG